MGIADVGHCLELFGAAEVGHGKLLRHVGLILSQHVYGKPVAALHDVKHARLAGHVEAHEGRVERNARQGADRDAAGLAGALCRHDDDGRGHPAHRGAKRARFFGHGETDQCMPVQTGMKDGLPAVFNCRPA